MKQIVVLVILTIVLLIPMILISYFVDEDPGDVIIEVTTEQFKFTPDIITVSYMVTVTLRITSLDVTHGFQLEDFELYNIVIPAGETIDVTFKANKKGSFQFYCTVLCGLGHNDHLGSLIVS